MHTWVISFLFSRSDVTTNLLVVEGKIVISDNMLNQRRKATFIRLRWLYGYKLKIKTHDGILFLICDFHRINALMLSRVTSS